MKRSWLRFGLVAMLLCSLPAFADAEDHGDPLTEIGFRFAMGGTTLRASPDDRMVGVEARAGVGYALGVYAVWWRYGWLRLHTELLDSSREVTLAETDGVMSATYSLKYLELPVLARVDVPLGSRVQPFAALGVSPAVLIDATHSLGEHSAITSCSRPRTTSCRCTARWRRSSTIRGPTPCIAR